MLAGGHAYTFRHRELGELGRIILQETPDGQCHISSEVVGDPSDPMTDERLKIFRPLGEQIIHILESALGSGQHTKPDSQLFIPKPFPPHEEIIESRLIPCERCGALAAQLIFAESTGDFGELEDCARKMFMQYRDHNVPTWVIGEPLGVPGLDTPARILKVWPSREPIQQMTANAFNAELDKLLERHCRPLPDYLSHVFKPKPPKEFEKPCSPGHCLRMLNENMRTDILKNVHQGIHQQKEKKSKKSPLVMLIKSIEDVLALFGSINLRVERNPFNADRYYHFDPEQDYQHDIKLLKFQLKELKKILKDIRSF